MRGGQHVAPARARFLDADAEKAQHDFAEDIIRHAQRRRDDDIGKRVRQNVAHDDFQMRLAERAGGEDELLFAQRERHAANHPRHARPADEAQDDDDHGINLRGTHARRKRRAQRNDEIQRGNGHDEFAEPHDDGVRRAGKITGNAADDHAESERQQNADDADGKRNLRAIKQPRKNVAPELVGAEKKNRIIVVARAEKVD